MKTNNSITLTVGYFRLQVISDGCSQVSVVVTSKVTEKSINDLVPIRLKELTALDLGAVIGYFKCIHHPSNLEEKNEN